MFPVLYARHAAAESSCKLRPRNALHSVFHVIDDVITRHRIALAQPHNFCMSPMQEPYVRNRNPHPSIRPFLGSWDFLQQPTVSKCRRLVSDCLVSVRH